MDVDNSAENKVVSYLRHLGLTAEQSRVYLFLLKEGPGTVLTISRGLKTGRTKLYPLLEELAHLQLITVHERHYGTSYEAYPPTALEFLVSEQEQKSDGLRKSLPSTVHTLEQLRLQAPSASKIIEYKGRDGLKQILWNLSKAATEIRILERPGLRLRAGRHFLDKLADSWSANGIIRHALANESEWNTQSKAAAHRDFSEVRHIDPARFSIGHETYIYNNCVAMLGEDGHDLYGIEFHNPLLCRQENQLFDFIWSDAEKITQSQ